MKDVPIHLVPQVPDNVLAKQIRDADIDDLYQCLEQKEKQNEQTGRVQFLKIPVTDHKIIQRRADEQGAHNSQSGKKQGKQHRRIKQEFIRSCIRQYPANETKIEVDIFLFSQCKCLLNI